MYGAFVGSLIFALTYSLNFYFLYVNANHLSFSEEELNVFVVIYYGGISVYSLCYLIGAIFFILWFLRAYRNIQILLPKSKFHYKPWAAVVSWFIPIWNLIGPYHIATDLFDRTERYLVSENAMDLRPRYDIVKGVWWGLWIVSGVVTRVSQYHLGNFPDSYVGHTSMFVGFLLSALCAFFAVKMIKNYSEMEKILTQVQTGENYRELEMKSDDLLDVGI